MKPMIGVPLTDRRLEAFVAWRYGQGASLQDAARMASLGRGIPPITGAGERAFARHQAGLEVTRGTPVAATRRVYGEGMAQRQQPLIRPASEDRSSLIRNFRSQPGLVAATFPIRASATFEDLPWWYQLGMKGGVAGVLQNTTAYKYDFIPDSTSDTLKSATFEDGDDTQAWRMPFGMVDSFSITGALGQPWLLELTIIGADLTPQAFTAAIGDRVTEDIETHLTKLAIGNVGAVPAGFLTGQVIGFKLNVANHLARKYFMDGLATPVMGGVGRADREVSLEVTWEGNAATVAERALWVSGTQRVARLQANGTTIAGSSPSQTKQAEIIESGKWTTWTVGNRETNTTMTGLLEAEYDSALGYEVDAFVVNSLVTLP